LTYAARAASASAIAEYTDEVGTPNDAR